MREIASSQGLSQIAAQVLDHPGFDVWSASSHPNLHHYGKGGLAQHTYEVLTYALKNREVAASQGHEVNIRTLICAALFHDLAKCFDYAPTDETMTAWKSTDHKTRIYHIAKSAIMWSKAVEKTGSCKDIEEDVTHAILAHHGLRQWGSPVEPRTRVAWILHLSDQMSARLNDCDTLHLGHK